ncbi:hypothetical protein F5883DRAFT_662169 [Diaporthe sp. PMI_573]|nr:hypothetical protein F5883DRAFT_662169 [Diaporthaceae sp. PMI_573]
MAFAKYLHQLGQYDSSSVMAKKRFLYCYYRVRIEVLTEANIRSGGKDQDDDEEEEEEEEDDEEVERLPTIVFEVNWSNHTRQQLDKRAQDFISLSHGETRTVVTFDFRDIYDKFQSEKSFKKGLAPARLSIWKAISDGEQTITPKKVVDKVFRNARGAPVRSVKLVLSLSDFFCEDRAANLPGCESSRAPVTPEEQTTKPDWADNAPHGSDGEVRGDN